MKKVLLADDKATSRELIRIAPESPELRYVARP